jgi:hypothetical protein
VAQTMYTHVSKDKNNKIKKKENYGFTTLFWGSFDISKMPSQNFSLIIL